MIAIYLNKQQALHADPKVIHQISFTGNLTRSGNAYGQIINAYTTFFITEEATETTLDFSQGTVKVL